jgi:hypothetical protein
MDMKELLLLKIDGMRGKWADNWSQNIFVKLNFSGRLFLFNTSKICKNSGTNPANINK